ncbi:3-hydroxyacyl-ACP dehydratase [Dyadobacter sp. NIV53]|uniref:3-hydroxyacyl-ACP dehydratase n=1 Tax=Dyadobacter sp. NIV53 TaxID=2861765 RepID=UPI001C873D86|nr:3-hydroxyacyl-ACP dehydratase [Dyadobacter sp. NIV53]
MFLNDLFTINSLNSTSETISAEIRLNANHSIFDGHFPGSPVTPGVIQLQVVKEIIEQQLNKSLRMKTMRTCKFLKVINPDETPVLQIDIKFKQEELLEVTASGAFEGNVFFKAQLSYVS